MFKQKLVHRLCTFKQKFAHTLCTFKQKFVCTLYTFRQKFLHTRLRPTFDLCLTCPGSCKVYTYLSLIGKLKLGDHLCFTIVMPGQFHTLGMFEKCVFTCRFCQIV